MKKLLTLFLCAGLVSSIYAQNQEKYRLPGPDSGYVPSVSNLQAREKFQDMKFGIFVHWGLYSIMGQGEWVLHNRNINAQEYALLANCFNPIHFDAEEWVDIFKSSGARYMTVTTRHHDSFSLFDSKVTEYDVMEATPFKRDVMKELSEACAKKDFKLHFYYSHLDWTREDYPIGWTGRGTGRDGSKADWDSYYQFMNDQLTELLTNYGPVGSIWFDGYWDHADKPDFDWHLEEQYALVHRLQPACLIGNNHHVKPYAGEDFQMFERDLPGQNEAGLSANSVVSQLPLESCITLSVGSWGYNMTNAFHDRDYVIGQLVGAAGRNANLLLNVGPRADGSIPAEVVKVLGEVGRWLEIYGDSIFGTRGGFVAPHSWGVTTQKDHRLFVHLLKQEDDCLYLPVGDRKVKSVKVMADDAHVHFTKVGGGILIQVPEHEKTVDYILEVTFR